MLDFSNINTLWGSLLIEECIRHGLTYFCVSPGSRSTPLTVAVARNPRANHIICYDERGAAFHALGYARATGKPAVLICTSGTAAANYYPAVIEADVDHVPMVILSSDRPPELRGTMANQTIEQQHLFGRTVRSFFDLPVPTPAIPHQMPLTTIAHAIYRSQTPSGPVHINCQFREPLAPTPQELPASYVEAATEYAESQRPITVYQAAERKVTDATLAEFVNIIKTTERGIVAVGQLKSAEDRDAVLRFVDKLGWPTIADVTSGLRLGSGTNALLPFFDQALLSTTNAHHPDTVIHIGGQLVSKRFLQFSARIRPKNYVIIKDSPERHDPFHGVTHRIHASINPMLSTVIPCFDRVIHRHWREAWQLANRKIKTLLDERKTDDILSEIDVARVVSQEIGADHALFMGNSMPIRDMDMYAVSNGARVPVAANRGASGIDGNLATAAGYAVGHDKATTFVVGDLTLMHDLNSLALLRMVKQPLTIVAINNGGGGIFHLLPIRDFEDVFEENFGTPHSFEYAHAAQMFGLDYFRPKTLSEFRQTYRAALQRPTHTLIELQTNRQQNYDQHKQLAAEIRQELGRSGGNEE
ncbi:MAG: 2-succinyl-5-enolpyruvyl-6-hydroxy-3-cyclohexene-1-carboxylic-acid synthase [Candidatus Promineifilaceae bacterium]